MRIAAALLLALCAAGASAGERDILQKGAPADASLEDLVNAGARTIPGTEIRYAFAGYLQLDAMWTRRGLTGDEKDTFLTSAIPFGPAERDARLGIRASQANAILQAPTAWGQLIALAQADLFRYEEGAKPNLTQLVVRLGEWLTVGKTYSTFMDEEGWPATLDYNGPSGAVFSRQAILRASVPVGPLRLEAALEDPQADVSAGSPGLGVSASADRPDIVGRIRIANDRGHVQLAGLSRSVTYSAQLPSGSGQRRISGSGISASAALNIGDDRLLAQWNRGQGIGRYFNDGLSGLGAVYDAGAGLQPLELTGVYLYYERKWATRWTTAAGVSELRSDSEGLRPASDLRRAQFASANLVHRMTRELFLGAELLYGRAERIDHTWADDTRLQLTARYYFY